MKVKGWSLDWPTRARSIRIRLISCCPTLDTFQELTAVPPKRSQLACLPQNIFTMGFSWDLRFPWKQRKKKRASDSQCQMRRDSRLRQLSGGGTTLHSPTAVKHQRPCLHAAAHRSHCTTISIESSRVDWKLLFCTVDLNHKRILM